MTLATWIPGGALIISVSALLILLYLAWERAPDGERFHARLAWAAQYTIYAVFLSGVALVLGWWWEAFPL